MITEGDPCLTQRMRELLLARVCARVALRHRILAAAQLESPLKSEPMQSMQAGNCADRGVRSLMVAMSLGMSLGFLACADKPAPSPGEGPRDLPIADVVQDAAAPVYDLTTPDPAYEEYMNPDRGGPSPVAVGFLSVSATPDGECTVALPTAVEQALSAWNGSFKLWRDRDYANGGYLRICSADGPPLPFAFAGDWNADGVADVVVDGYDSARRALVAVMSAAGEPGRYTVSLILESALFSIPSAGEARWPTASVHIRRPRKTDPCTGEPPPFELVGDNFSISWDDKPSDTHYYDGAAWTTTNESC